jgi:hypothetical protein
MDAFEREIEAMDNDLASGAITMQEYTRNIRELERDYRDCAQDSAQEAYEREMDRW